MSRHRLDWLTTRRWKQKEPSEGNDRDNYPTSDEEMKKSSKDVFTEWRQRQFIYTHTTHTNWSLGLDFGFVLMERKRKLLRIHSPATRVTSKRKRGAKKRQLPDSFVGWKWNQGRNVERRRERMNWTGKGGWHSFAYEKNCPLSLLFSCFTYIATEREKEVTIIVFVQNSLSPWIKSKVFCFLWFVSLFWKQSSS